jgi:hypothetical protein
MAQEPKNLEKPTPCRFHSGQYEKLVKAGVKFRMRPAALIRQAVDEALQRWESGEPIIVRQK